MLTHLYFFFLDARKNLQHMIRRFIVATQNLGQLPSKKFLQTA